MREGSRLERGGECEGSTMSQFAGILLYTTKIAIVESLECEIDYQEVLALPYIQPAVLTALTYQLILIHGHLDESERRSRPLVCLIGHLFFFLSYTLPHCRVSGSRICASSNLSIYQNV